MSLLEIIFGKGRKHLNVFTYYTRKISLWLTINWLFVLLRTYFIFLETFKQEHAEAANQKRDYRHKDHILYVSGCNIWTSTITRSAITNSAQIKSEI